MAKRLRKAAHFPLYITDQSVINESMTAFKPKEPKFRRRAEARPDEVLDAALALFTEKGFSQTTVDQIARRAGFSKGTVYLYFTSKDAILEALVERAIAPLTGSVFDAMQGYKGDPRPVLAMFLRQVGQALSDDAVRAVPMIILREASIAPQLASLFRDKVLFLALPAIAALLAQGVQGGHIRPIDPELTARSVMGPIIAQIVLFEVFSVAPDGGLQLDELVENHLQILCAGLAPLEGDAQ